jgi:hypothetical protein
MMPDDYESLGPQIRGRLDKAETDLVKVREYISIMAESDTGYPHARVLCLLLGLARPTRETGK